MSFHQSYQSEFSNRDPAADLKRILQTAAPYGVQLEQAPAAPGQAAWRVLGVHHLTPDENRGRHAVFIDLVDEQGQPLRDPSLRLAWGWAGQRPDERAEPKRFDKPLSEPAANVDVYVGQHIWVQVTGDGLPSDTVVNLHTKHDDELGPNGELWNSTGHHSFYILFQRTARTVIVPPPEAERPRPEPELEVIRFGPFSRQDLINAFARAADALDLDDSWALANRAGLAIADLAADRRARYAGAPLHELPNLSNREKNALKQALAQVLKTMPTPPLESVAPPPVTPEPEPPTPPPAPPVYGNKLGFYCHISTNQDNLWDAIRRVQPPVILIHADTANRMLLEEIRRFRAPDAFVIGRLYKDNHTQRMMLETDPEQHGRAMADEILTRDFGLATQQGANGRLLIDAWMSLNEAVPGPGSRQFHEQPEETARLLAAYDRFQVAFRQRLQDAGVEAVAFNFGAGNFGRPEHYLDHFPQTLQAYTYLGFHEYGWPTLYPDPGSATSAGTYRACMEGIRARFGDRHRVIITEAGLTRMYQNAQWGDKGWLNDDAPLSEDEYWHSLDWYNTHLLADDYVLGTCLYEVGHHGDWRTFRHLGKDRQGNDIRLMDRIVAIKEAQPRAVQPAAAAFPVELPVPITIEGVVTLGGFSVLGASVRLTGGDETLGATPNAALDAPSYVAWSRSIRGVQGNLWTLWVREVAQEVAGLAWPEFKHQFGLVNPQFAAKGGSLQPEGTYWLTENPRNPDGTRAISIVWDRPVSGFQGNLWDAFVRFVQNKVVGLTYNAFKEEVLLVNPSLQESEQFVAAQRYSLPRNEGHKRYALQAYANARGRFAFEGLRAGDYELTVSARGAEVYHTAFSVQDDVTLDIKLLPLAATRQDAMLSAMPTARQAIRTHDFVQVVNRDFVERGESFRFVGVNVRGLVHYGDRRTLPHSQPGHRHEQLQAAYAMGARVARVFLPSMHADAATTIDRLLRTVKLISDHFPGLYLLPCFANLYADVPFRIRGDEGFYGRIDETWDGDLLSGDFFHGGYTRNFLPFVRQVVQTFAHEPVIFGWGIGNELKLNPANGAHAGDPNLTAFVAFMQRAAQEIRAVDGRHLITTGIISTHHCWLQHIQELQRRLYGGGHFDFMTVHCYNHEYHNDDSGLAASLNLPFIVEEAGFDTSFVNARGGNRARLIREDMDRWFGLGAGGYMQWGFMATPHDMGDGDGKSGMDRALHNDWDALFHTYQARATQLAGARRPIVAPPPKTRPSKPMSLAEGAVVYAQTVINVRKTPGHINPPDGDVIGQLADGAQAIITGESVTADELVWWPITARLSDGRSADGWVAQAIPGQALISTAQPAPVALPRGFAVLAVG